MFNNKLQPRPQTSAATSVASSRVLTPAVDIYENDEEILIRADVPGVRVDGVTVRFEKDHLLLSARREAAPGPIEGGPAFEYQRSFVIPRGIDAEQVKADLSAGVLNVHLPKGAASKPRFIEVRAA